GSRSNCPRGPLASSSIAPNLGHGLAPIASSQKYIQWVHPTKHTAFYRLLLRAGRRPPSLSHGSWNAAVGLILTKIGIGRTHLILTRPSFLQSTSFPTKADTCPTEDTSVWFLATRVFCRLR